MTVLSKITTGRQMQLPDGRRVGFAEFGDPAGKPIFLFHPHPGSRLFRHPDDPTTANLGIRLITIDRPGFGLSDFQKTRRILGFPDDVICLADALRIDRFAVLGVGAGGAYAAACAYKIGRRLSGAGIVSSLSPTLRRRSRENVMPIMSNLYRIANIAPRLLRLTLYFGAREAQRDPERYLERLDVPNLCEADRAILHDPTFRALLIEDIGEAFRNNSTPFAEDIILVARPWGFRLQDIRIPVRLWHGELDVFAPIQMGHDLAEAIFGCHATYYPDEGHKIIFTHWAEILSSLISYN